MLQLIIVDDHPVVRKNLEHYLGNVDFINIVGTVSGGPDVRKMLTQGVDCNVVLTDRDIPLMSGIELTKLIKKEFSAIQVLMLSLHDQADYEREAIEAGATALISKSAELEELYQALFLINDASLSSDTKSA